MNTVTKPPPPGWYPDPTGTGWRYWDGTRWGQAAAPAGRRRSYGWFVAVVAAVVLLVVTVLCSVLVDAGANSMLGPGQGEIKKVADDVRLPASLELIEERWSGNRMCLEECYELLREYRSPSPRPETYRLVTDAVANAGFTQVDSWGGFDDGRSRFSIWKRSGRFIEVSVSAAQDYVPPGPLGEVRAVLKFR